MSFPLILLAFSTAAVAAHAVSAVQREASIFGLVMEDATFADAQRILGPAEVRHNGGDAAGSAYVSCYVGSDGVALVLSRTSEQSPEAITSFQLLTRFTLADFSEDARFKPHPAALPDCARSAKVSRAVATGGGLRLGMTLSDVERVLAHKIQCGSHSKCSVELEDKERSVRDRDGKIVGHPSAWITIRLEQGRVAAIRVVYSSMI